MCRIPGKAQLILALFLLASCDDDGTGPSSSVETVAVVPGLFSLIVGDTLRLSTIARGERGNPIAGRLVAWETSSASVVTVSDSGLVTATGAGGANITATVDGRVGTATVNVSPNFGTTTFASVTSGGSHTCALTSSGVAYCWGRNESGQLGVSRPVSTCFAPPVACALVPIPVDGNLRFEQLSAGGMHTCGLMSDGSAWCWGSNAFGQLGDGSETARSAPVAAATTERFTRIVSGYAHTCALTASGVAWCWGENVRGELGDGTSERRLSPVQVVAPGGVAFRQIAPGGDAHRGFTCGVTSAGAALCWGANDRGQLGRGTRDLSLSPNPQPGTVSGGRVYTMVVAGFGDQSCGLTAAGAAYCWGGASHGALGDGSLLDSFLPVPVAGGISFTQLVAGGASPDVSHTCGVSSTGSAYCWGDNRVGALGDGTSTERRIPAAVVGGHKFASITTGFRHTCGRTVGGTLYCWGSSLGGQCGGNSLLSSSAPVKVVGQP